MPVRYGRMNLLNQQCWRQNVNALVHSVFVSVCLTAMVASDRQLRDERPLHAYNSVLGLCGLCFSMGYFSHAIPWSTYLYAHGEREATNLALVVHHFIVYGGALTYVLGRTCALYGAVAFASMEFTNWFYIMHTLQARSCLTLTHARA